MGATRFVMQITENHYIKYANSIKSKISIKNLKLKRKSLLVIDSCDEENCQSKRSISRMSATLPND